MSTLTNINYDSPFTLGNSFTRTGHTFVNWNTLANGTGTSYSSTSYVANLTTTNGATVTLYAQWTANTYTVTFDANGGGTPSPTTKTVTYASTYETLATVTRSGFTFNGWFTATSGGIQILSTTTVTTTANQTLFARWTAAAAANPSILNGSLGLCSGFRCTAN
jgi:uncharacterized repeat protein (TIGR02543 family)